MARARRPTHASTREAGGAYGPPRLGLLLAVLLPTLVAACSSTRTYRPDPGPYDRVPQAWTEELARARRAFEEGDLRAAHDVVRPLAAQRPQVIPVRLFLQDLQVALLERGETVGGVGLPEGADPGAVLGDVYLERADANPDAVSYVLAARLATSGEDALATLEAAAAEDSSCVWVPYGRAWWYARMRRFPEARAEVERAFRRDEGHLATMRLHASLLAGAAETGPAIEVLEAWLERTEEDPLVAPSLRAEAVVDLAALEVLEERPGRALDLLVALPEGVLVDPGRAELVRAVALEDLDQRSLALSAARRAWDPARRDLLPLVHQAMLLAFEGNATQERLTWERLLEEADAKDARQGEGAAAGELDLGDLLIRLRANARLQALDAAAARQNPGRRGPPAEVRP